MSYIIQNLVMPQHSRSRMMLLNRLNSLEEHERSERRRSRQASSDDSESYISSRRISGKNSTYAHSDMQPVKEDDDDEIAVIARNYGIIIKDIFYVLLYFLCGVLFYHYYEGWDAVKCLYFIVVSMTTVGYGDVFPTNNLSRVVTILYLFFGLVFIFSIINDGVQECLNQIEKKAAEGPELRQAHMSKIMISIITILLFLLLGTLFFKYNEEWDFIESVYWTFSTVSTIGYGDLILKHESSRIFSIFYIILAVILMTTSLGNFAAVRAEIELERHKIEMLNKELDIEALQAMDVDGNGVDEIEFVTAMLVQVCGLDMEKDIMPWRRRFKELDKDNSGALDEEDLRLLKEEEEAKRLKRLERMGVVPSAKESSAPFLSTNLKKLVDWLGLRAVYGLTDDVSNTSPVASNCRNTFCSPPRVVPSDDLEMGKDYVLGVVSPYARSESDIGRGMLKMTSFDENPSSNTMDDVAISQFDQAHTSP